MRAHLVITFIMFASLFYCEQSFSTCKNVRFINYSQNVLENGTYSAIVEYYNPKTYQNSRYQLQVTVSSDRVIAIHLGNGGSIVLPIFRPHDQPFTFMNVFFFLFVFFFSMLF